MIDGSLIGTLLGHSDSVKYITISNDNTKIFTGSNDNTAIVWDLTTMKKLYKLGGNNFAIDLVKFDSITSMVHTASIFMYQGF